MQVIQTGVGHAKAKVVGRRVFEESALDVAVSSGFACALVPAQPGDLLIGSAVSEGDEPGAWEEPLRCAPHLVSLATAATAGMPAHVGGFVSTRRVLCRADEKRRVAERTHAIGVDMESAALAMAAAERRVPFIIIRAASDLVDEDLPLDFNLLLQPSGWWREAAQMLHHPASLAGLWRLRRQAAAASARLTAAFEKFLDQVA